MSQPRRGRLLLAGLCAALLCVSGGYALAGINLEGQAEFGATGSANPAPATWRTVTVADDADRADPEDAQATVSNPTIYVTADFSAAGATAWVEINLYESTAAGSFVTTAWVGTLTAPTTITNGARYALDETVATSARAMPYYDVQVRAISSGNVRIRAWAGSAAPLAAQ